MRVDIYLKKTRLVPRRSGATELCREGKVSINDREAKPGKSVQPGDHIRFRLPGRELLVEVLSLPEGGGISKVLARTFYSLLEEKRFDLWGREISKGTGARE